MATFNTPVGRVRVQSQRRYVAVVTDVKSASSCLRAIVVARSDTFATLRKRVPDLYIIDTTDGHYAAPGTDVLQPVR